jgi:tetratricopeptide (TPR) repeat protein
LLEQTRWPEDALDERQTLLCSLALISWRAARVLDLSSEAQRWESEYLRAFRRSLQWDVLEAAWHSKDPASFSACDLLSSGEENLFQALLYLQEQIESSPGRVSTVAIDLYRSLQVEGTYALDLQSYFMGSAARLAGATVRYVGVQEEASDWLDLAENHFRAGRDAKPQLARVTLLRLVILYTVSRCDVVLRVAPELDRTFASLGMDEDQVKCRIVWAASLKASGDLDGALNVLESIQGSRPKVRPGLYGWVLLQLGDVHQIRGDYDRGRNELLEAASLFKEGRQLTGLAEVHSMIAYHYRAHGELREALQLFKRGRQEFARLGVKAYEAYNRVLAAETYLAMGCHREAEREILKALPSIEEQGMIADAVAAVSILREAVRRRNLDPQVLREVTERLRPKK